MSKSVLTTTIQTNRRSLIEVESNHGLRTDTITLRPLGFGDESDYVGAINHSRKAMRRWIPLESDGQSAADYFQQQVHKALQGDQSGTGCRRGVFLNDNTFVGMVNILKIERGMEWTGEINWWIDSSHTGKGLATVALQAMMDHAFTDIIVGLGLHKLRAMICLDNHASVRLAEKLGFKNSGVKDLLPVNKALVMHHEFVRFA